MQDEAMSREKTLRLADDIFQMESELNNAKDKFTRDLMKTGQTQFVSVNWRGLRMELQRQSNPKRRRV